MNSRYWTLAKRPPPPWPDEDTFALKEAPVPTPGPGQALTRTIYVSLDPYQWGYKRRGEEPAGAPCHARSVSQVVESRIDGLAAGDFVFNTNGWAEYGLMGEGVPRPGYLRSPPPEHLAGQSFVRDVLLSAGWAHSPGFAARPIAPGPLGGL